MAVPKKKRYKQVITTRRTIFNLFNLKQKNIDITFFLGKILFKNEVKLILKKKLENIWLNNNERRRDVLRMLK